MNKTKGCLIANFATVPSKEAGDQFHLYRVFQFRDGPRLFTLPGDLSQHVHLKPTDYRASFRSLVG
ncbi:hypothetical protein C4676_26825 [Salmonella enterica subsp. enterica serovar Anatum]|nr:hypothetical protein C4676_26825 [Salmonella enterica subsp. enterica serovar Anatum]